uniref:Uncharacterized protein n=1 Tax=Arundo donax TaxID=35708 RepID=A0A0A9HBF5_ARUDO
MTVDGKVKWCIMLYAIYFSNALFAKTLLLCIEDLALDNGINP